jgi:hypothetical protein
MRLANTSSCDIQSPPIRVVVDSPSAVRTRPPSDCTCSPTKSIMIHSFGSVVLFVCGAQASTAATAATMLRRIGRKLNIFQDTELMA